MKKSILLFLISILSFNCYSQITYEKGYFINNSNEKINCLIKNVDWKNNPTQFEYKISENTEERKITIESVKEFEIHNTTKYKRYTINIDRSSKVIGEMSYEKNPIFKKEQLFLKVLITGKANLFQYRDGNLNRFFYSKSNSTVEQLIFKNFKLLNGSVKQNNRFKQQLLNDLNCNNNTLTKDIKNIDYRKNELKNFFMKYNEFENSEFKVFESKQTRDSFNLTLRPSFNSSSLTIQNSTSIERKADFGNKTGMKFGIEFEFILPFNKNKWAILIEPTYQQFKSENEILGIPTATLPIDTKVEIEYKSIEVPIGVRHYMFLNEKSKLFINASIIIDFDSNSKIDFEKLPDLEVKTNNNLAFGLGYKYNNKYSLEFRFTTSRNLLSTQSAWSSDYTSSSLVFGYTIF